MKNTAVIFVLLSAIFFISGCGQQVDISVYNSTAIFGAEWVAINTHTEHHDQWFWPNSYATRAEDCDSTNSITFKAPESDTLIVSANGQMYASGVTASGLANFNVPSSSQLIYGGLLEDTHWYGEVNLTSVIFYKK